MAAEISIYACDSAQKAATARAILIGQGFAPENITVEQTNVMIYDAAQFDGGKVDAVYSKIIVIGKK